jgi:hypothetical protein
MVYSATTVSSRIMTNVPRPVFRFTDDDSVVMSTRASEPRYDSGGDSGGATGFNIDINTLTEAQILIRTGDAIGVIAFGTDTLDLYVYDGTAWQIYENS